MSAQTITLTLPAYDYQLGEYVVEADTGAFVDDERTCLCGEPMEDGDIVRYRAGEITHVACYQREIEAMSVRRAWIAIAEDMQRAPGSHSAATLRAVLQNLAALAATAPTRTENP